MDTHEPNELTPQELEALEILSRDFDQANSAVAKADNKAQKSVGVLAGITGGFCSHEDQARGLTGAYQGCAFLLLECLKKATRFHAAEASAEYASRLDAMERTGWETLFRVLEMRACHLASLLRQVSAKKSVPLIQMGLDDAGHVVSSADDVVKATAGAIATVVSATNLSDKEALRERIDRIASEFVRDIQLPVSQACDVLERAGSRIEAAHYKRLFLPP
jgi:hypothetical protein